METGTGVGTETTSNTVESMNTDTVGTEVGAQTKTAEEKPKTFDDILANPEYQSEFDRRINSAVIKNGEAIKKTHDEEMRLSTLSQTEKDKALEKKRITDLEARETEVRVGNLKLDAIKILDEKDISAKALEMVLGKDAESTKVNIDNFTSLLSEEVERKVNDRLKGTSIKAAEVNTKTGDTSPAFKRNFR